MARRLARIGRLRSCIDCTNWADRHSVPSAERPPLRASPPPRGSLANIKRTSERKLPSQGSRRDSPAARLAAAARLHCEATFLLNILVTRQRAAQRRSAENVANVRWAVFQSLEKHRAADFRHPNCALYVAGGD